MPWLYLLLNLLPPCSVCWIANLHAMLKNEDQAVKDAVDEYDIANTWRYRFAQMLTVLIPVRLVKTVETAADVAKKQSEPKIQMSFRMRLVRSVSVAHEQIYKAKLHELMYC